jgi:hypothetical protein
MFSLFLFWLSHCLTIVRVIGLNYLSIELEGDHGFVFLTLKFIVFLFVCYKGEESGFNMLNLAILYEWSSLYL